MVHSTWGRRPDFIVQMDSAANSYSRGPSNSYTARQADYLQEEYRPSLLLDLSRDTLSHSSAFAAAHPFRLDAQPPAGPHAVPSSSNSMHSPILEPHPPLSHYAPRSAVEATFDHRLRTLSAPLIPNAQPQWSHGAQVDLPGGDDQLGAGSTLNYKGPTAHWSPGTSPMAITHRRLLSASMTMDSSPPSFHAMPIGAGAANVATGYQPQTTHHIEQAQSTGPTHQAPSARSSTYQIDSNLTSLPPHVASYSAVGGNSLSTLYPELDSGEGHRPSSLSYPPTGCGGFTLPNNATGSTRSNRWHPRSSHIPSTARHSSTPPPPPHAQASYTFPADPTAGASNAIPMSLHCSLQPSEYHSNSFASESNARGGQCVFTQGRPPPPTSNSSSTSHGDEPSLGVSRDAYKGTRAPRETASGQTAFHPAPLQGVSIKRSPSWSTSDHSDEATSVGDSGVKKRRRRRRANEPPRDAATRRFPCPQCGKMFARPSALSTHERSHSKEKPHLCPNPKCQRPFAAPSNLRRHQKVYNHFGPEGEDGKSSSISSVKSYSRSAWQKDDDDKVDHAQDDSDEVIRQSLSRTRLRTELS
ncbi:BQ5605_C001g00178 [Microbotryum silenes-dioicae]|uniref:BQ5605_C001g00178 protein n=1 Tax=Microbotryum silenes-dioicae TaxID=796604 RepID=A0A2X0M6J1_9BASI|nr:BQ5605_C001g00178 [Microbotryum silenes-dioicae]